MKLEIKNLCKTFLKTVKALDEVSLEVLPGESLGVVGESGSGKTTLAKILAGFLEEDKGTVKFGDQNLLTLSHKDRAPLVQMVFQDPYASLNPKLPLKLQIHEALRSVGKKDIQEEADRLMKDVGLTSDYLNRYPHQLSGGQRQRFAIARALAANPRLLLADEPVSSLDLSVQAQIINLLNFLRNEKKFSQIVISHDLAVIANTCDRVVVMKEGKIIETGEVEAVLSHPQEKYTQRLLEAAPVV